VGNCKGIIFYSRRKSRLVAPDGQNRIINTLSNIAQTGKRRKTMANLSRRKPQTYNRIIDIDERGEYRAHIEDSTRRTVYEYKFSEDESLIEDGYMRNWEAV
jgi:hypothetical protein